MPTTAAHALRYPAATDPADVPSDMQKLASDVDVALIPCDTVVAAATRVLRSFLVQGDANAAWVVTGNGKQSWGAGGANALDTTLFRAGPNYLATGGGFYANQGAANQFLLGTDGHLYFGSANDTHLYRPAAATLQTDQKFFAGQEMRAAAQATQLLIFGDVSPYCGGSARPGIVFGSAGDSWLARASANVLNAGGCDLNVERNFMCKGGWAAQVRMGDPWANNTAAIVFNVNADAGLLQSGGSGSKIANYTYSQGYGPFDALAYNVASDRSLKVDEQRVEPDWHDQLLSAGIYTYRYRRGSDTEGRHLGMMADELPDVVRSVGEVKGADETQMVDLYKLSTALLGTVQHLAGRLAALEAQLAN
jgi:hypothetical protein